MENPNPANSDQSFQLIAAPDVTGELFVRAVLEDMERPPVNALCSA
jgi:hypothetical protein